MARLIPAEGNPESKICLIGEAPGVTEERLGRPFVGPAGQLLDECLRNAGIQRRECYITYVVKERPINNEIHRFIDIRKVKPVITEVGQRYLDDFINEVSRCKANVIVPMGNVPLWALTGLKMIIKRRGSIMQSSDGHKIIPTIHPVAALQEYLYKYVIQHDLRRVEKHSHFPHIPELPYKLKVAPSFGEVIEFLQTILLNAGTRITCEFDIEVLNREVSCLSVGYSYTSMSIPFTDEQGDYFSSDQEVEIWELLTQILEHPKITKLGQFITSFDAPFIFQRYGIVISPMADCGVAAAIAFPDLPRGLDYTTSIYTELPYYKDDGKQWFKLGGTFKDLWIYNAKDSVVLPDIFKQQMITLAKQNNINAYNMQVSLGEPLTYISSRGIRIDYEGLQEARTRVIDELDNLFAQFKTECGYDCNPRSPAQLKELFYVKRDHRPYVSRGTGAVTTDRDALKRLSRKGDNAAKLLLQIRSLAKLKDTYYDVSLDSDQRLRCSFNPAGTTSGRLSSSKTIFGTGMNMQNIPDKFRRHLLVDEGYVGYQIDLSQAENRVVAYIAPDYLMTEAFESGIDVHALTASLIFGKRIEEISNEPGSSTIGGGIYSERFWGKKANHGLNYDLGYRKFAFLYEIPEGDARYIVEKYHAAYPGIRRYHSWVQLALRQSRTLIDCLGRSHLFLDRWGDELFKEAYSRIPQATVAGKLNRDGVIHMWTWRNTTYKGVELLNQVHDSIWFQIPTSVPFERHALILLNIKASLESNIQWKGTSFSIPADVEICASNFGKCHETENPYGLKKLKVISPQAIEEYWSQYVNGQKAT